MIAFHLNRYMNDYKLGLLCFAFTSCTLLRKLIRLAYLNNCNLDNVSVRVDIKRCNCRSVHQLQGKHLLLRNECNFVVILHLADLALRKIMLTSTVDVTLIISGRKSLRLFYSLITIRTVFKKDF